MFLFNVAFYYFIRLLIYLQVFGVAFVFLGGAIVYRAITSLNAAATRGFMIFFACLVYIFV